LEVATLCLLILTLWAASVFSIYPKCEVSEGKSLWWCDALSVIIGLADAALVVIIFLVFMWLKGAAGCMNRCFGELAAAARVTSARVSRRVTKEWDMRHGGETAVQARIRRNTVEAGDNTTMVNPVADSQIGEEAKTKSIAIETGISVEPGANTRINLMTGRQTKSKRRGGRKTKSGNIEMVQFAQSRKARRCSYDKRLSTLKKLNQQRAPRIGNNPMLLSQNRTAAYKYSADADDEIDLEDGDVIEDVVDYGDGWSSGRNARTGEIGSFPSSFVE
jgi:hypothetical protein